MSSHGICDTRCATFLSAMIHKEENTRIRWFLKNRQQLLDHLGKFKEIELQPIHKSKKQPIVDTVRLKTLPNWRSLEPDGSISIDIMKPVDPQLKLNFTDTETYLRERVKLIPEDRFYYPDCSSWVYGWRIKDYPFGPRNTFGRQCTMQRQFYHPSISSLQRDPEWYCSSNRTTFICNEII